MGSTIAATTGLRIHGSRLSLALVGALVLVIATQTVVEAAWTGWSQVPSSPPIGESPTAARYGNQLWLFARRTPGAVQIVQNRFASGAGWSGWTVPSISGPGPLSGVTATVYNNRLYLFRPHNYSNGRFILMSRYNSSTSTWSAWTEIPGAKPTNNPVAAVSYASRLWLFVRGDDNRIYRSRFNGTSWSAWSEVPGGGLTEASPAAAVYDSRLFLFVRGLDGQIYRNRYNGSSWSGWAPIPGGLTTLNQPAAVAFDGRLWLFARRNDNRIYRNRWTGTAWLGWAEVAGGGLTNAGPAAAVYDSRLFLFVRGLDNTVFVNRF